VKLVANVMPLPRRCEYCLGFLNWATLINGKKTNSRKKWESWPVGALVRELIVYMNC